MLVVVSASLSSPFAIVMCTLLCNAAQSLQSEVKGAGEIAVAQEVAVVTFVYPQQTVGLTCALIAPCHTTIHRCLFAAKPSWQLLVLKPLRSAVIS